MNAFSDPAATWNSRFEAAEGYLFGTQPNQYLQDQARHLRPGGRVLCVADGDGRNSVWLARQGFGVDAFDIAEVGVRKAQALARDAGVRVNHQVADAETFAWPQSHYDAVAAIFIQFADPAQRARLFERMAQALVPGGVLVLQGYTPQQLVYKTGGPPLLSHLYTEALLREAFAALQIEDLVAYEAELAEGTQHRGRSALVGLVARRPA
jgi:2-polyprenyl-3-methyl-5-hydroxy-6-metoxy-1,4-benzoquinol methylase